MILLLSACSNKFPEEYMGLYTIYYFNQVDNTMNEEPILLNMPPDASNDIILYAIVEQLYNRIILSISAVPMNIHLKNHIAEVTFDEHYLQIPVEEQMLLRAALVYTLTDLDFIVGAEFSIYDQPLMNDYGTELGVMDREDIIFGAVNPNPATNYQTLILYFRQEDTNYLVAETREIQINQDVPLEQYILEELIKGPYWSGLEPTIPDTTSINYVETKENVCQVDLSYNRQAKELLAENGEELFVYSIVNSLTEIWGIQKVGFLIDGDRLESSSGTLLFERNEQLITRD